MTSCHIISEACYTAICRAWQWVKKQVARQAGWLFFICISAGGIAPPAPAEAADGAEAVRTGRVLSVQGEAQMSVQGEAQMPAQAHRQRAWFNLIICPISSQPAPKFQYVLSLPPGMFETIEIIDINGQQRECVWQTRDREAI